MTTSQCAANTVSASRLYKLTGVKESLYHPKLPSLRRMDMDSSACKLPDEHSRLSTRCGSEGFRRTANATRKVLRDDNKNGNTFVETRNIPSGIEFIYDVTDAMMQGEKKDVADSVVDVADSSWKSSSGKEPAIDITGQGIVPANISNKHRALSSTLRYSVSDYAWKH